MRSKTKKLLAVLATTAMACSIVAGGVLTVSAGTVENKPAGSGLLSPSGELNTTNFKIIGEESNESAYKTSVGNHAIYLKSSANTQLLPWVGVDKDTMAKDNIKVRYQMTFYSFVSTWGVSAWQWYFNPLSETVDGSQGATNLFIWANQEYLQNTQAASVVRDDDHQLIVTLNDKKGNKQEVNISTPVVAGSATSKAEGDMIFRNDTIQPVINKNGYATMYVDVTLQEDKWADVEIGVGVADETGAIPEETVTSKMTIANLGQYNPENSLFFPSIFCGGTDATIDDVRITAFYTEEEKPKSKTICYFDMEDEKKIYKGWEAGIDGNLLVSQYELVSTSELGITVTNPEVGSGIVTRSALVKDSTLPINLELDTKFAFQVLTEGQKVGLGFGFTKSTAFTGAHKYLYFTVQNETVGGDEGTESGATREAATVTKVYFCGESVDKDGNTTSLFDPVEVTGATVGTDAEPIALRLVGKLNNLEITVGDEEPFTVTDFDYAGYFAVLHKGMSTGETENLTYMIRDGLTISGYEFAENAEDAKAISSNFTGNYISMNKFQMNSTVAPDIHIAKAETTTHEIEGMVAENGKVGFYGASTGSRILTKEQYADFVMQFDYTSVPVLERGQLVGPFTRYSAAYMVFGMKEGGLAITDSSVYTLGIEDGLAFNPTMYSDNETVIAALGMANTCGGVTRAYSKMKEVIEPTANSIPSYYEVRTEEDGTKTLITAGGGYDATKENNNVKSWWEVDEERTAETNGYSFYAKTTRVKLVVINNQVALYGAELDTATGEVKGDYKLFMSFTAEDSFGYLGIASDSPAWFEIDNLAVTPISREKTLEWANSEAGKTTPAANLVEDIAPADMANDPMPTPLAKPAPVANTAEKKVTWTAVTGAKEYKITVKLGSETLIEKTVTTTEIDLSELTAEGDYKVTVEAVAEDLDAHTNSRETVTYKVTAGGTTTPTDPSNPSNPDDGKPDDNNPDDNPDDGDTGCNSGCNGSITGIGMLGVLAMGAACFVLRRKK